MTDKGPAVEASVGAAGGGAGAYVTPYGEVRIHSIEIDGETVNVFLDGDTEGGEPHFRIVNPPLLVPDPNGDVLTADGPYRYDPLAAIVDVIGSLGGARKMEGRRKR